MLIANLSSLFTAAVFHVVYIMIYYERIM